MRSIDLARHYLSHLDLSNLQVFLQICDKHLVLRSLRDQEPQTRLEGRQFASVREGMKLPHLQKTRHLYGVQRINVFGFFASVIAVAATH